MYVNRTFNNSVDQVSAVVEVLKNLDPNFTLFLSGGSSPLDLYAHLSHNFSFLFPKTLALTDERWGAKDHTNSNEHLIKTTGLMGRIYWEKAELVSVISDENKGFTADTKDFEQHVTSIFQHNPKNSVGIVGMTFDCGTLGVLPNTVGTNSSKHVVGYTSIDHYKYRITLTLNAIKQNFHTCILLLNDEHKLRVFNRVFEHEHDISKFPVLVYKDVPNFYVFTLG